LKQAGVPTLLWIGRNASSVLQDQGDTKCFHHRTSAWLQGLWGWFWSLCPAPRPWPRRPRTSPSRQTFQASCILNGGTLAFGVYDGTQNDASGQFSYQCTGGTNINVTLGLGQNPQGSQRAMVIDGGGDTLAYELYSDSNRQTVWDDSVGVDINGVSAAQEFAQVYGRILAGEDAPAGNYSDTVLITLVVE
jgi:spore coat protein U-like protein